MCLWVLICELYVIHLNCRTLPLGDFFLSKCVYIVFIMLHLSECLGSLVPSCYPLTSKISMFPCSVPFQQACVQVIFTPRQCLRGKIFLPLLINGKKFLKPLLKKFCQEGFNKIPQKCPFCSQLFLQTADISHKVPHWASGIIQMHKKTCFDCLGCTLRQKLMKLMCTFAD